MTEQETFNQAYLASLQPELLDLFNTLRPEDEDGGQAARMMKGGLLAGKGFPVDVPIQVLHGDPFVIMMIREQAMSFGVPKYVAVNGMPLTISTNPADFPKFTPPPVVVPPATHAPDWVGAWQGMGDFYASLPNDPTPDGKVVTDSRGSFMRVYHTIPTVFGLSIQSYYKKLPDATA
jgi:hypothetical protein